MRKMSLGVCCQWLEERTKRDGTKVLENSIDEQGLQLGCFNARKYSKDRIISTYRNNVGEIIKVIPKLVSNNIKVFRLSSSLLPLFEFNIETAKTDSELINLLKISGNLFRQNGIRVTTHPGQYVVLSSESDRVVNNSITDLAYHTWVFDCMGLSATQYNAINIHGGKKDKLSQLIATINKLPANIKDRLTLENDEMSYNINQLLLLSKETNVPIVWDSHHHSFNSDNVSYEKAYELSTETWHKLNIKPLQHVSNTSPGLENANFIQKRKHSDYILKMPKCQFNGILKDQIDIEVEAKMKNIAVLRMRSEFRIF
jgi:UV DNA damage endonuclease